MRPRPFGATSTAPPGVMSRHRHVTQRQAQGDLVGTGIGDEVAQPFVEFIRKNLESPENTALAIAP